ncbi:MAG: D-alanyl-D-alanine carboxypeptidase [Candidatus Komeilibacteria bacterium]|jgi:serine-type D-Ala-D-Ala endopeptidase (penicillin-binding protein 7)|nr:D-alanyl-D-alanine carboxypeptidase [Candidatus Komeilibacteria bacterium]MBT4447810.1 D-alanyl-D-alanine carboxypeptidase [Candidatus Komeilibacteria bacterium]
MNLWILISTIILGLGLTSNPAYQLPLISIFESEENTTASFEAVELDDAAEIIPHKIDNKSLGVKIAAQSAATMDKNTGLILWQKNADQVRSIASITKLMTALVFLDNNPGWDTEITLEKQDEINGGTNRILRGEVVTVHDIFYTSLIASDNNATRALVRSTGVLEEEFIQKMNNKAKELNLANTNFVDPTGLKDNNKSTALDILSLAKVAFDNQYINDAVSKAVYNFQAISGANHKIISTNKLFNSFLNIKAGKTGFVNASGYCLVAEVVGEGESDIISVVLGSDSHDGRFQDLKILSAWVLDNFSWS